VLKRLEPILRERNLPTDWRKAYEQPGDVGVRPDLASLGPFRWHPSPAPNWQLSDMQGSTLSLEQYRGKPLLMVFYLGAGCPHCIEQLNAIAPMTKDFTAAGISIVAVSSDSIAGLKETFDQIKEENRFAFPIVSNEDQSVFKSYRAFDDFENAPLHGVFLIDGAGLVRWQDISYKPYKEIAFLLGEAKRLLTLPAPLPPAEPGKNVAAVQ
jgi:peroxiredoxin